MKKNKIDLFELPSWRVIALGRNRRNNEDLQSLIGDVEDVFESWFKTFTAMHTSNSGFSLSHGSFWNTRSTKTPYLSDYYLFTLAQQKIVKFNEICKVISDNCCPNHINIYLKYLRGGLYARATAREYSEISDTVNSYLNQYLHKSIFIWNGNPCVEIYREPYPKHASDDAIQIFFPVKPRDGCIGIIYCCSYCGKYYQIEEVSKLQGCCKRFASKVKFNSFGETVSHGEY